MATFKDIPLCNTTGSCDLPAATAGEVCAADIVSLRDGVRQFVAAHLLQAAALSLGQVGVAAGIPNVGEILAAEIGLVLRAALFQVRDRLGAAFDDAPVLAGLMGSEE